MQQNYKCNVNTEAADDLMLNEAGCSVITEMQFVSHNGCCSKLKCRERQGMGEEKGELVCFPNDYWQGDARWVFFSALPCLLLSLQGLFGKSS